MKNFLVPAAAFGIAVSLVWGGGKLLKMTNVPKPYTISGLAVALFGLEYRSITSHPRND